MNDVLMWPMAALSLLGNIAVMKRRRWGWACWIISNAAWVGYDLWLHAWSQAALFAAYEVIAIWAWFAWKEKA